MVVTDATLRNANVARPLPDRESSTVRRQHTIHVMETTTDINSIIDGYLAMWNEPDGAVRSKKARDIWAADGRLVDPLIDAIGPDAIAAAIGELRDQMPGHSLTRTTAIDAHHDQARFGWTVNAPDGTIAVTGIDVVTLAADGRVQSAIGFFEDAEVAA